MRGSLPINVTEDHDHIAKCVLLACCHHEGCFRCSRGIKVACSTIGAMRLCIFSLAVQQHKLGQMVLDGSHEVVSWVSQMLASAY